jgi:hypothetical protein
MRRSSHVFTAALLAVFLCGSISYAQVTTANILGTVTDTSGAVVPSAKVSANGFLRWSATIFR